MVLWVDTESLWHTKTRFGDLLTPRPCSPDVALPFPWSRALLPCIAVFPRKSAQTQDLFHVLHQGEGFSLLRQLGGGLSKSRKWLLLKCRSYFKHTSKVQRGEDPAASEAYLADLILKPAHMLQNMSCTLLQAGPGAGRLHAVPDISKESPFSIRESREKE